MVKTVTMYMMTYVTSYHNLLFQVMFRPHSTFLRRVQKIQSVCGCCAHSKAVRVFTEGVEFLDHLTTAAFSRDPVHRGAVCLGV